MLVGCDKEVPCMRKSMPGFVEVYDSRFLNDRSDMPGNKLLKAYGNALTPPVVILQISFSFLPGVHAVYNWQQ